MATLLLFPFQRRVLPLLRPLALVTASPSHCRALSTHNLIDSPTVNHDLSGFLKRATARIEKHKKTPYGRGQGDLMTDLLAPSDLKWLEALRQSVQNQLLLP